MKTHLDNLLETCILGYILDSLYSDSSSHVCSCRAFPDTPERSYIFVNQLLPYFCFDITNRSSNTLIGSLQDDNDSFVALSMTLSYSQSIENDHHDEIIPFLESFLTPESMELQSQWDRVKCCHASRSLYCSECYQLLIPTAHWPKNIQAAVNNTTFRLLPFDLHVILQDRRKSATGLHVAVLDKITRKQQVVVVDMERKEPIPEYQERKGPFLLFPSHDSVPLAQVATTIQTLVVLDCKWTHATIREHASIATLPKVHLTNPPKESHYWRWHNAGSGMLSTMEAVYVAAKEVITKLPNKEHYNFSILLWLFALQRASILRHTKDDQREAPFTKAGKEEQRVLRRQQCTRKMSLASVEPTDTQQRVIKKPRWCSSLRKYDTDKDIKL